MANIRPRSKGQPAIDRNLADQGIIPAVRDALKGETSLVRGLTNFLKANWALTFNYSPRSINFTFTYDFGPRPDLILNGIEDIWFEFQKHPVAFDKYIRSHGYGKTFSEKRDNASTEFRNAMYSYVWVFFWIFEHTTQCNGYPTRDQLVRIAQGTRCLQMHKVTFDLLTTPERFFKLLGGLVTLQIQPRLRCEQVLFNVNPDICRPLKSDTGYKILNLYSIIGSVIEELKLPVCTVNEMYEGTSSIPSSITDVVYTPKDIITGKPALLVDQSTSHSLQELSIATAYCIRFSDSNGPVDLDIISRNYPVSDAFDSKGFTKGLSYDPPASRSFAQTINENNGLTIVIDQSLIQQFFSVHTEIDTRALSPYETYNLFGILPDVPIKDTGWKGDPAAPRPPGATIAIRPKILATPFNLPVSTPFDFAKSLIVPFPDSIKSLAARTD